MAHLLLCAWMAVLWGHTCFQALQNVCPAMGIAVLKQAVLGLCLTLTKTMAAEIAPWCN